MAMTPNVIVIFADDLGYGDLRCYSLDAPPTPHLDRMAKEGTRFTHFYSASPGCSPSRAALLTGCYPQRVSIPNVLGPGSRTGLNPEETTLADLLKPKGYATACVGKWHLGVKNLMPLAHGFDAYFGIPYSNDMWPPNGKEYPPLPLYRDREVVETIDNLEEQGMLTQRFTEFGIEFIRKNRLRPFFLYLAHPMPHVPISASPESRGKTGRGLYADTIAELDDSVGKILGEVKRLGLSRRTLVLFASDNGPWTPYGNHAGSTGGLRPGKGTTFEGGMRVPAIAWMPGTVAAGRVSNELATTMDWLPTIASMVGATLPNKPIDGRDISGLLRDDSTQSPHRWFYYYWPGELQAVRSGPWKLHVPHSHRLQSGAPGMDGRSAGETTGQIGLSLFHLGQDPGESTNLADQQPEVVRRLLNLVDIGRKELGDTLTKTQGSGVRPPGQVGD